MSAAAQAAFNRLQAAVEHATPDCLGDDRFIADKQDLAFETRAELEAICWQCPLRAPCAEFAALAKPKAGYWPRVEGKVQ